MCVSFCNYSMDHRFSASNLGFVEKLSMYLTVFIEDI